jgi:hypothetical protein
MRINLLSYVPYLVNVRFKEFIVFDSLLDNQMKAYESFYWCGFNMHRNDVGAYIFDLKNENLAAMNYCLEQPGKLGVVSQVVFNIIMLWLASARSLWSKVMLRPWTRDFALLNAAKARKRRIKIKFIQIYYTKRIL